MAFDELIIAEKPSVGKAIADNLGGRVEPVRGSNGRPSHFIVGNKVVTWVFGHILELAEPEDYNAAFKGSWMDSVSLLPIVPETWKLKSVASSKEQLSVIKGLLKDTKTVVHAGDPDREGQMLVDEVLEFLGNKKPVMRILPNAIDDKSMKRIIATVVDNKQFLGRYHAGIARQRGDWLIGMNMTRACTTSNQRSGMRGTLSVGRVQTPTLAMIVRRDMEIDNFKPQTYYDMTANFAHPKGGYVGRWSAPKGFSGLDSEGRLIDMAAAAKIKADCEGKMGKVVDYRVENQSQSPPLPFSLSTLQKKASEVYKMGAKQVLEICQKLYEKKIATYPRTDSQHLPEDQLSEAKYVLEGIANFDPSLAKFAQEANPALKSPAWNSKKVTAHHAIVPTGETNFASLTDPERKVFALIVKQFIAQFYPNYTYSQTSVLTSCSGHDFKSSGRTPLDLGWRKIFGAEERAEKAATAKEGADASNEQLLPPLKAGDQVRCDKINAGKKLTKPPPRFTEGTLIHAMTNVHEIVSDPEVKKKLKEVKGIGTEATRGDTIETLKRRMFVSTDIEAGKIISTAAGKAFILALPKDLTDVTLTALWENALDQIEKGGMTLERFVEGQTQWIKKLTRQALEMKISVAVGFNNAESVQSATAGAGSVCPGCGKGTMCIREAKQGANKGQFFLSCSQYPDCKQTAQIEGQNSTAKKPAAARKTSSRNSGGKAAESRRSTGSAGNSD